jgi:uncharacterized protein HemX
MDKLKEIPITVYVMILLAIGSGVWLLQESRMHNQSAQTQYISDLQSNVSENTRRIKALEESFKGVPEQISSMSTDIKYLRQSVEMWNQRFFKDQ